VRQRDDFLARLAHELRNPLAPICNAMEIMRRHGRLDPVLERARAVVDRQARQLTRLVDDLLEVSRITRGKISLRLEPVDLAEVVSAAVETARPVIEARRHQIEVVLPQEPLVVRGDLARLAQVFSNLLNNAAKYTEPGGRIELTVARADGQAVVSVKDTGVGIAPELLPHIFDAFVQGDGVSGQHQPGLGLGLAVVRQLVEKHGGSVRALSAGPGRGSEFVVRLPLRAPSRPPEERRPAEPIRAPADPLPAVAQPGAGRRVLIVDDNRDAAESLALLLEMTGHQPRVVLDGPAALDLAPAFRPDLVFLDIGMPKLDGYEVARRLRQLPGLEGVTLVALTGYGQEQDRRRAQEAGFDAHCIKPVDYATILDLLKAPERGARAASPSPARGTPPAV
jgi:CheY-like chemotaxis protein